MKAYKSAAIKGGKMVQLGTNLNLKGSLVGIDPSNSAAENVTAFNEALTRGNLYVDTVGAYEIDNTIFIPSNRKLEFTAGCTVKKETGSNFSFVFANKGLITGDRNSNITIVGNGLTIEQNGVDTYNLAAIRMIGIISFGMVDKFNLSGIQYLDGGVEQYFCHFGDVNNFTISDITVDSLKDGLHFDGNSHHGLVQDCNFTVSDDAIALFAKTWPNYQYCVGDVHDINFENITTTINYGYHSRMSPGSWAVWNSGNTYNKNDLCVSSGNIYWKTNANAIIGTTVPTHSSGAVVGADGIEWTFYQVGTFTEANVYNIKFLNHNITAATAILLPADMDTYTRDIYPGTEGNAYLENIEFKDIVYNVSGTASFVTINNFCKSIKLDNITVNAGANTYNLVTISASSVTNRVEKLTVNNCDISFGTGSQIIFKASTSYLDEISTSDNIIDAGGGVPMLNIQNRIDERVLINLSNSALSNFSHLVLSGYGYDINSINNHFSNYERIYYALTTTSLIVNFTSNGDTFDVPNNILFWREDSYSTIIIDIVNSTGIIQPDKVCSSKVNIIQCSLFNLTELVTNGSFDVDSSWIKEPGWTISGGKAVSNSSGYAAIYEAISLIVNDYYIATYNKTTTSGIVSCAPGNSPSSIIPDYYRLFKYTVNHPSWGKSIAFYANPAFVGTIDNVSVKHITY